MPINLWPSEERIKKFCVKVWHPLGSTKVQNSVKWAQWTLPMLTIPAFTSCTKFKLEFKGRASCIEMSTYRRKERHDREEEENWEGGKVRKEKRKKMAKERF